MGHGPRLTYTRFKAKGLTTEVRVVRPRLLTLLITRDNHVVAASDDGGELIATNSEIRVDATHRSTKDTSEASANGQQGSEDCYLHGADSTVLIRSKELY